jgi:ABC-type transport system involved in multi-copper enzyme maturation permease subunit
MTTTTGGAPVGEANAQPPRRSMNTPSLMTASLRVFDVSLGEMLWSRRTVFLGLIVGGPVLLAVILRVVDMLNLPAMKVNGIRVGGSAIFGLMMWFMFLRFIVPILGIFYGTSLIADEVEDKTITYLFTRPISRSAVLIGKYLAYLASTTLIVLPSVMLVYFLVVPIGGSSIAATFPNLLRDLLLLAVGLAVYGALFAAVGAWIRRPVLFGLFFAFGWENFALALPGYLKRFTIAFYTQGLVPHTMPQENLLSLLQSFFRESVGPVQAVVTLLAIGAVSLGLATRAVERREYVLEQ